VGSFNRTPNNSDDPGCIFLAELHLYGGAVFGNRSNAVSGAFRRILRVHLPPCEGGSGRYIRT